jgi:cysteinyl-tRNA synthetase
VSIWVHGEHLLMNSAKMAKSAGNVITIQTLIDQGHDPLAFRYLCFLGRYRRQVDFTDEALEGAATTLRRLRERVAMLGAFGPAPTTDAELRAALSDQRSIGYHDRFVGAVADDLDFPQALTVLHELLSDNDVSPDDRRTLAESWDEVLGLRLARTEELPAELEALVKEREEARAAKDFARADALRDRLRESGVELLDSAAGTRWVRR